MHLHTATTVDDSDRKQLEWLRRYMLRPHFAHDAVKALPDGRVRILFRAAWRSGVAHADMTSDKLLVRLCALVPLPGFHMTKYFGASPLPARPHHPPAAVPALELQLALGLGRAKTLTSDVILIRGRSHALP